ncbi:BON domain-containing protein [Shinella kummerowiae]|uniref:BON domain-containing protein n=1 Tax=Shinella kummerowiae TaxID=417745 RepID=UPI0021B608D7|nr:BON domain-containing protein [Shinella kummerowiae]MCT7664089.1 BON domain-containing protein [Shinella kummerowiae]
MADRKQVSREEDFRDYEERDTRDGWPYPDDDDARRAAQNLPYASPGADLDQLDNGGVAITGDPAARDVDGAPLSFADETGDIIGDDDLEARIMETLEDDARVDLATLELAIRDGVAVLDGAVDSEEDRRHLIGFLRRVKGVRDVEADGLLARGVDSHLPRDVAG